MPTPTSRNDVIWMLPVYVGCWAGAVTSAMTSPGGTGNRYGQTLHAGVSGILLAIAAVIGLNYWCSLSKAWKPALDSKSLGLVILLAFHILVLAFGFVAASGFY